MVRNEIPRERMEGEEMITYSGKAAGLNNEGDEVLDTEGETMMKWLGKK